MARDQSAYFPLLPGVRAVPACVHVRSTPVAAQATSTLDLPKLAVTVSPQALGAGSERLFWPFTASRAPASSVKAAMPSLAKAATAVLGMKGATTARTLTRSAAPPTTARTSSRVESTSAVPAGCCPFAAGSGAGEGAVRLREG